MTSLTIELPDEETRKPLAARIREIWADLPDEVRAKLPTDGASQRDHYIYGIPKRTRSAVPQFRN